MGVRAYQWWGKMFDITSCKKFQKKQQKDHHVHFKSDHILAKINYIVGKSTD